VLLLLNSAKLILEIAGMALLGQGVLYLLAGSRRDSNLFYQLLKAVTNPFTWLARRITPPLVIDRHVPFVAFFLVALLWFVVTIEKINYCVSVNMVGCR
jgi:hypothetical protein